MSMQEMAAVITRFQTATDALAALGARLGIGEGDTVAPEILAALDADGAAGQLRNAGGKDVHSLTRTWPIPIGFVTGQKA
jgi:Mrp family chromosome partitioning ATPase